MQRNLFKFVALNSFKIVWVVSVVLFTCVIANAQILQTGKDKAVVQCIENFKVTEKKSEFGKILTISFRTRTAVEAEVMIEKWGSYPGRKQTGWVTVARMIAEEGVSQPTENHSFRSGLGVMEANMPGNMYRLYLTARKYIGSVDRYGGIGRSLDRTYSCQKEFTVGDPTGTPTRPMKSLNNLRLKGAKPKP